VAAAGVGRSGGHLPPRLFDLAAQEALVAPRVGQQQYPLRRHRVDEALQLIAGAAVAPPIAGQVEHDQIGAGQ